MPLSRQAARLQESGNRAQLGIHMAANRTIERIGFAASAAGFMAWSAVFIHRSSLIAVDGRRYFGLFDDAMISMRYAWNFSHGLGLVWNPGERIEGYSNLLMTLLMALSTLLFSKPAAVLAVQVFGAALMLASAVLTMRIADHVLQEESPSRRLLGRMLAFFCTLAYYPLLYWSLMGMETGLLTVLLLSSILLAFKYVQSPGPASLRWMAVCLGLAWLTRNDSLIFAVLVSAYVWWDSPHLARTRGALRVVLPAVGLYVLFIFGQLLFRQLYYGELLPNTYTLKMTGLPMLTRWRHGVRFVEQFMQESVFVLGLAAAGVLTRFQRRKLLLLALLAATLAYQVYVGGEQWTLWRIMSPSMPLVFILVISAALALVRRLAGEAGREPAAARRGWQAAALTAVVCLVVVLGAMYSVDARFLAQMSFQTPAYQLLQNHRYINMAVAVDRVTTPDATVGVVWAGSIPYYTGRWAIDFLGKSDRYIARLPSDGLNAPGHDKYDLRYSIRELRPTFVQRLYYADQDLTRWGASRYVTADFRGVRLTLLRESPTVLWDKVQVIPQ